MGESAFRTIVADPPWLPEIGATWNSSYRDKARPHSRYKTMTLDEIKALNVPFHNLAHLYLWCLPQHVDWGYEVARAWNAKPVILLTWCKPGMGNGRFQCNTEHVLVARVGPRQGNQFGASGRAVSTTQGTWFSWSRGRHSEKPDDFFQLVEKISPGPRLEMFARKLRLGWSVWGNEVDSDVVITMKDSHE